MGEEVKSEISEPLEHDICFIITPIGEEGSVIRKKTDGLIDNVLEPICNELNMEAIPAHKIDKLGSITNQVVQNVLDSKMVIANLTGLNPNVMYELAIRHAIKKPVVCIAEQGTKLPFDITTERTIFYSDDMYGATRLRSELRDKLQAALSDKDIDNPIYRAKTESMIIKDIQSSPTKDSKSDLLLYILHRLENIEDAIKSNTNFKSKCDTSLCNLSENENVSGTQHEFSFTLSRSISDEERSDIFNYIDAHIGHDGIINFIISDSEIILYTESDTILPFFKDLVMFLKEKYHIKVLSINRLKRVGKYLIKSRVRI